MYGDRVARGAIGRQQVAVRSEPADPPPLVRADPVQLQQVIVNLVGNAIKFTDQGEVVVDVSLASRERQRPEQVPPVADAPGSPDICFAVRDTGIGIPPDKQQIIFEAFQQADGSTSRKFGGTGLGLAISREISRLLGGEIRQLGGIDVVILQRLVDLSQRAELRLRITGCRRTLRGDGSAALLGIATDQHAAEQQKKPAAATANPCAQYGEGWVRVKDTNTCVKIGGSVRVDIGR